MTIWFPTRLCNAEVWITGLLENGVFFLQMSCELRCDWVVNVRFKGKSMTYYLHAQDAERDWKLRNQCSVGEVFLNDS